MELLAVIEGLESIKVENASVLVVSDSKYVVDSVEKKWVFGWEKKNFEKRKNPDFWPRFLKVYRKHKISFKWKKGHAGHPMNERCDVLAVNAANSGDLLPDTYYETIGSKLTD
jgi:ribonuclease HI